MNLLPGERIPCLSDLFLDRLLAGDMDQIERSTGEAHLGGCPTCRERLAAISAESAAFALHAPPLPSAPVRPAVARRPRRWSGAGRWLAPGALLAAGVAASMVLFRPSGGQGPEGPERTKGGGSPLGYWVLRDGVAREGAADQPLRAGDAVQFVYRAAEDGFLAILSVDERGQTSVYYPTGPLAAPVPAGSPQPLPQSTILDASLGRETIHAVHCPRPVPVESLRLALAANPARFQAPAGCRLDTLWYQKEASP